MGTTRSLPPLPRSRTTPSLPLDVVDVEAHGLGDARPGAVEQLEQGPVAQGCRGVADRRGLEQPLDVLDRDRLGQAGGGSAAG